MFVMSTHRPRNVNAYRAAGMLYGDWGTSKAYVIGLAFAIAGYASFWPILAVSALSLIVGLNYTIICKHYPNGGGVYASARKRSQILAFMGAFFLVADYIVTAALSALSAFHYFGTPDPAIYSAIFIILMGLFNYFGPKHTGTFAVIIAISAVAVFTVLAVISVPFLGQGWHNLEPIKNPLSFWTQFCSVIVALSGVEAIANTTSVMKLNRGSTSKNPLVTNTSTPAILVVMAEVIIYTTLFGLAAAAISNFTVKDLVVSAPGFPDVGDSILSYLALIFGGKLFGSTFGVIFSFVLKIIVGLILLSAVNTAINGLVALQYLMASDHELPSLFRRSNSFGVPLIPLVITTVVPAILILVFKKIVFLADLYAIGFVGAIAVNLGATSTDFSLDLGRVKRVFMFCTFVIMACIEVTLFIQKPHARNFAIAVLVVGFGLRQIAKMMRQREILPMPEEFSTEGIKGGIVCVVKRFGKAVRSAVEESNQTQIPLNIVFVREQKVFAEKDLKKSGGNDLLALRVFEYVQQHVEHKQASYNYSVTDSFTDIAVAYAERFEASQIIIDQPVSKILLLLRGNYVRGIHKKLPENVALRVAKR